MMDKCEDESCAVHNRVDVHRTTESDVMMIDYLGDLAVVTDMISLHDDSDVVAVLKAALFPRWATFIFRVNDGTVADVVMSPEWHSEATEEPLSAEWRHLGIVEGVRGDEGFLDALKIADMIRKTKSD